MNLSEILDVTISGISFLRNLQPLLDFVQSFSKVSKAGGNSKAGVRNKFLMG